MLVLSRRPKEKIVFPDLQIVIQVLEIKGDRVRLGFEAPGSVSILRGELLVSSKALQDGDSQNSGAGEAVAPGEPPMAARPPLLRRACGATLRSAMASAKS